MKVDRITSDPARMNGQLCIRDLRLTVRRVLEAVALYSDRAEVLREYPPSAALPRVRDGTVFDIQILNLAPSLLQPEGAGTTWSGHRVFVAVLIPEGSQKLAGGRRPPDCDDEAFDPGGVEGSAANPPTPPGSGDWSVRWSSTTG